VTDLALRQFDAPNGCTQDPTLPGAEPLIAAGEIRLSEILSALSLSLDLTQGQPAGHAMRSGLIGMRLANVLGLSSADRRALFYALLLKDVGCSSNAAKMAYLFGADEHHVKHEGKLVDWSRAGEKMKYVWRTCAPGGSVIDKLLRIGALAKSGPRGERMIVEVRCERGAAIARELDFPAATSEAIRALDELWNGKGHPRGLKRQQIPLLAQICNLAQTVEIFFRMYGRQAVLDMLSERRGKWFDPALVDVLLLSKDDDAFWTELACDNPATALARWEPQDGQTIADDVYIDTVASAFAGVVDAKSPWTFKHSTRVAEVAECMAREFGVDDALRRDVRRAGLLHDIGKLGVSSLVLDKPGKLDDEEWLQLRRHALYSQQILSQLPAFALLSDVASAHHERLDGRGYHRGVPANRLHWVSRVLAVADIYEALSANRPYRAGMPWEKIQSILHEERGRGLDPECVDALGRCHEPFTAQTRAESQLEQLDKLLTEAAAI
jgi:putative nucleotidyltransferase with HDIG domain